MTAVTAIDLCVAEIAVRYGGFDFWSENLPSLERLREKLAGKTVPSVAAILLLLAFHPLRDELVLVSANGNGNGNAPEND